MSIPIGGADFPEGLTTADVNKDGHLDIAVAVEPLSGHGRVMVLLGDGHAGFRPASGYALGGPAVGAAGVAVFTGDGHGGSAPAVRFPVEAGGSPPGLATGDLNGDGLLDIVTANANLGGLGEVTVLVNKYLLVTATNPDAWEPTWTPLGSPVALSLSTGPANRTNLSVPYKLVIPGGKVLRKGDVYSENVLYSASSRVP